MIKIAVITTSRSDYGILSPLLKKINTSELLNLELIVSGSHLSENLGYTLDEIKEDGFNNYHLIDINIDMNNIIPYSNNSSRHGPSFQISI